MVSLSSLALRASLGFGLWLRASGLEVRDYGASSATQTLRRCQRARGLPATSGMSNGREVGDRSTITYMATGSQRNMQRICNPTGPHAEHASVPVARPPAQSACLGRRGVPVHPWSGRLRRLRACPLRRPTAKPQANARLHARAKCIPQSVRRQVRQCASR